MNIAIVEDDRNIAQDIILGIKKENLNHPYNFNHILSGLDALYYIKHKKPGIIILEHMLPFIKGFDIAREVCYEYNPIIILLKSDQDVCQPTNDKYKQYIDYTLIKPIDIKIVGSIFTDIMSKANTHNFSSPRLMRKNTVIYDQTMLKSTIKEMFNDLNITINRNERKFLVDALKMLMDSNSNSSIDYICSELSKKHNISSSSALIILSKIVKKINGQNHSEVFISSLTNEVLKKC